ncbi:hypothetical protein AVEN_193687-1 [Araneus ventricosus]|uniref:Uncharacterized protein n=1 Tax=Araneus ventricosus TaxID=182803 RepID=A0A4Y2RR28_ARAVE|nr:hypothetical protein AVEN_193687-1 [Araneus ventricosus]
MSTSLSSRYLRMHFAIALPVPLAGPIHSLSYGLPCFLSFSAYLVIIEQYRLALGHISVIREPGEQYVGHVTPVSGHINKCILKYLEDNDADITELESIGCDGTATNTG